MPPTVTRQELIDLTEKLNSGNASEAEKAFLQQYYAYYEKSPEFLEIYPAEEVAALGAEIKSAVLLHIGKEPVVESTSSALLFPLWKKVGIAASFLLVIGTAVWLWLGRSQHNNDQQLNTTLVQDILPGKEGAILTLADGTQLVLDSAGNNIVGTQNNYQLLLSNGRLSYVHDSTGKATSAEAENNISNTITTPNGRQFQLLLSDGTKVWLNAGSSMSYPLQFSGDERRIQLTGEAYFEVAKNTKTPFVVDVNNMAEVEVLGTGFNIAAYKNDPAIKTTLVEGAVRVKERSGTNSAMLVPGDQAIIDNLKKSPLTVQRNVDIEKAIAWKNGLFNFEGASLKEVMKQLERWYDIEVVYKDTAIDMQFVGEMSKDIPFSELLEVFKKMRLSYQLERGRRLIIL